MARNVLETFIDVLQNVKGIHMHPRFYTEVDYDY